MNEKHTFRCSCGSEFQTTFAKFQNRNKRQCNACGNFQKISNSRLTIDDVRLKIESFGCELISNTYAKYRTKLIIRCACGNIYSQTLANFLNGTHRCQQCAQKISNEAKNKYTYEQVEQLCHSHDCELLSQKNSNYINRKDKISLRCSCGEIFSTKLFMCLDYEKYKCNSCTALDAPQLLGEVEIEKYLKSKKYIYKKEYSFSDCYNKYVLRFDFAVFVDNEIKLIEYDGMQHFRPYDYYGGKETFENIVLRDEIKNKYCENNNIPLLRIPYNKKNEIVEILDKYLVA